MFKLPEDLAQHLKLVGTFAVLLFSTVLLTVALFVVAENKGKMRQLKNQLTDTEREVKLWEGGVLGDQKKVMEMTRLRKRQYFQKVVIKLNLLITTLVNILKDSKATLTARKLLHDAGMPENMSIKTFIERLKKIKLGFQKEINHPK